MKTTYSRLGLILSGSYFVLFCIAVIFSVSANNLLGMFPGAFVGLFAWPWYMVMDNLIASVPVVDSVSDFDIQLVGYSTFYLIAFLIIVPGTLINGTILYLTGKFLENRFKKNPAP